MKKLTVTIGIPAYKEEKNIVRFLKSVLMQKEDGFKLNEIWVHSDRSVDRTVKLAKSLKSKIEKCCLFLKKLSFKETISLILTFTERLLGIKPPKVTVLLFHSVSGDGTLVDISRKNFATQIEYLRRNFDLISLNEVIKFIKGEFTPKRPSVALTFDDGYKDLLKNAIPLLSKYSIPATFFVVAEPNRVNRFELQNSKQLVTTRDIRKIRKAGYTIASHTLTHINLKDASDYFSDKEIKESKRVLEKNLKTEISYFAYPKGIYSDNSVKKVSKIYKAAFIAKPGVINTGTDIHKIYRMGVDRTISNKMFASLFTNWIILYFGFKSIFFILMEILRSYINWKPSNASNTNT